MDLTEKLDDEDYWNSSKTSAFNFDYDDAEETVGAFTKEYKLFDDNTSEISLDVGSNDLPLSLLISDWELQKILDEQSMIENPTPKHINPDEELRLLRRKIQERIHPPPVDTTVNKILLGKSNMLALGVYKSFEDKEKLLDEAINSGCGNAILMVVLFIKMTLTFQLFCRLLQTRRKALGQYINYLEMTHQPMECTNFQTTMGKHHEAALFKLDVISNQSLMLDERSQKLKSIYVEYFSQSLVGHFHKLLMEKYINLLQWQLAQRTKDKLVAKWIGDSTVLQCLYYVSSIHKWNTKTADGIETPYTFAEIYGVSDMQFDWLIITERASNQMWPDLQKLFEKKSWHQLNTKAFVVHIPIDRIIFQLYSLNAPNAVMHFYLTKIDDFNRRLAIARKTKVHKSIIDSLQGLKNKDELERFKMTLSNGSEEYYYAENAIKTLNTTKWKPDTSKFMGNK